MLIIAHRGNGTNNPENSMEAIKAISKIGVDLVEVDVRVTLDGVPILHHDEFMVINGSRVLVNQTSLPEIRNAIRSITTLEQALSLPGIKYLLEIKSAEDVNCIADAIDRTNRHKDIIVTSFDYSALLNVRSRFPKIELAVLDRWSGIRAKYRADKLDCETIIINQKWLWDDYIKLISKSKYKLYTYTLNDPAKAARWSNLGLSGIITDQPSLVKESTKQTGY